MSTVPTLENISSEIINTSRLKMHALFSGPESGKPVLFIHGNASSATYWEEIMLKLPDGYRGIAIDLRGYGDTEDKLIDATRGMNDWLDDVISFVDAIGLENFHVVGHSLGGTLLFSLIASKSQRVLSATLVAPGSPYGFGGTKDEDGTPCNDDFAGSGGGIVNPDFARLIAEGDRSSDDPQASPRVVMNSFYWKPPFIPEREEDLLSSMLTEKIGPERYPGDFVASENWPNIAPGKWGPLNAASPKYLGDSVERFLGSSPKPPILWVRGDSDQIVGDDSLFDLGTLGQMELVPGWPGLEVYPPQPSLKQTRKVLENYQTAGGHYQEVVMADTAHCPYIEKPDEFMQIFHSFLEE